MFSGKGKRKKRNRRKGSRLEDIVAARYRRAGYNVKKHKITSKGEIDVFSRKGDEKIAIEVKSGKQRVTSSEIEKIAEKARSIGAKPVIILGRKTKITAFARKRAKSLKVKIKRLHFHKGN